MRVGYFYINNIKNNHLRKKNRGINKEKLLLIYIFKCKITSS